MLRNNEIIIHKNKPERNKGRYVIVTSKKKTKIGEELVHLFSKTQCYSRYFNNNCSIMTYNLLSAVGHGSALEQPISSHADDNENDTETCFLYIIK